LPNTSFSELAKRFGPQVDAALTLRLELGEGCPTRLREAMQYSLLAPGKRLRPLLVLLAAEACGGTIASAMPAACAVEMIHTYSLVHDDLPAMDDDDLRRGRPTCHKAFDEATAVLVGDALLTLAFEVLANEIQPPAVAAACCAALAQAAGPCGMVGGQMDDVAGDCHNFRLSENGTGPLDVTSPSPSLLHLDSIHRRKTGAMIRVSLRLGALIAAATSDQLAALDDYGHRLGLAFQITDDLLDVQSSEDLTGKRVGKDAEQGKLTFPGILGLDQSTQYARQLVSEASEALVPFGADAEGLQAVALFVLERNR
jgi:geranylgeranyl diphosphate synthase, type II